MGEDCLGNPLNEADAFALARFRPGGALDEHFGRKGTSTDLIEGQPAFATELAVEPNGDRVVVVGTLTTSGSDIAVARYLAG